MLICRGVCAENFAPGGLRRSPRARRRGERALELDGSDAWYRKPSQSASFDPPKKKTRRHFGAGAPPILEPILVGVGMFTGTGF